MRSWGLRPDFQRTGNPGRPIVFGPGTPFHDRGGTGPWKGQRSNLGWVLEGAGSKRWIRAFLQMREIVGR
jgi:hypothetical protein